ncbi:hypothetical protein Tco_1481998 [Tanacetum coccineum]
MDIGLRQGDPCFLFGVTINIAKSRSFGVGVPISDVEVVAYNHEVASLSDAPKFWIFLENGNGCFLMEKGALWRNVISCFYGDYGGFGFSSCLISSKSVWCDILKAIELTETLGSYGPRLMDIFLTLYDLELIKIAKSINVDILLTVYGEGVEKWCWPGDSSVRFKVKSLSVFTQNNLLSDCILGVHHIWSSWISRKVNNCARRASLNRLATRVTISLRDTSTPCNLFPFCDNVVEDVDRFLIYCPNILPFWRETWIWCGLLPLFRFSSFTIEDIALERIGLSKLWIADRYVLKRVNWNRWINSPKRVRVVENFVVVMIVVKKMAVVMIVVEKSVVAYFLDSCNLRTRIVDFDDTPIVIDKHVRAVTFAFHKGETVATSLSVGNLG